MFIKPAVKYTVRSRDNLNSEFQIYSVCMILRQYFNFILYNLETDPYFLLVFNNTCEQTGCQFSCAFNGARDILNVKMRALFQEGISLITLKQQLFDFSRLPTASRPLYLFLLDNNFTPFNSNLPIFPHTAHSKYQTFLNGN